MLQRTQICVVNAWYQSTFGFEEQVRKEGKIGGLAAGEEVAINVHRHHDRGTANGDAEPEETYEDGDKQESSLTEDDNIGGDQFAMGKIEGGSGL
ncbi:Hypothetical protein NGAL_HAMBI1145_39830 [Neorhizobium galegae bv. officinalis]|uniref:Uncharacterized protein n=1 Tax=Neorhizobium galegae bv. officinalis TaxID=323656 RepID=A0A0T7FRQ7_NEOGA|nr:hypothetical protein [Neorhizobium galegae]CDZ37665.1 Hypothetical protein NGAL_HAMBI1145_39830 [Neorhizobium galegae bv. officinalis]